MVICFVNYVVPFTRLLSPVIILHDADRVDFFRQCMDAFFWAMWKRSDGSIFMLTKYLVYNIGSFKQAVSSLLNVQCGHPVSPAIYAFQRPQLRSLISREARDSIHDMWVNNLFHPESFDMGPGKYYRLTHSLQESPRMDRDNWPSGMGSTGLREFRDCMLVDAKHMVDLYYTPDNGTIDQELLERVNLYLATAKRPFNTIAIPVMDFQSVTNKKIINSIRRVLKQHGSRRFFIRTQPSSLFDILDIPDWPGQIDDDKETLPKEVVQLQETHEAFTWVVTPGDPSGRKTVLLQFNAHVGQFKLEMRTTTPDTGWSTPDPLICYQGPLEAMDDTVITGLAGLADKHTGSFKIQLGDLSLTNQDDETTPPFKPANERLMHGKVCQLCSCTKQLVHLELVIRSNKIQLQNPVNLLFEAVKGHKKLEVLQTSFLLHTPFPYTKERKINTKRITSIVSQLPLLRSFRVQPCFGHGTIDGSSKQMAVDLFDALSVSQSLTQIDIQSLYSGPSLRFNIEMFCERNKHLANWNKLRKVTEESILHALLPNFWSIIESYIHSQDVLYSVVKRCSSGLAARHLENYSRKREAAQASVTRRAPQQPKTA